MVPLSISQHFGGSFLASGSLKQTRICLFFPHPSQWCEFMLSHLKGMSPAPFEVGKI